jgi:replication factor A1
VRFNFTSVGDLQTVENTTIDTIGVLKEVGETSQITSKTTSKPYDKRELTLVDNTNYSVRLTIWGNTATSFDITPESVIAFKGVKVSDFGGRSLSLLSSGSMTVDPDIDEAHKLKGGMMLKAGQTHSRRTPLWVLQWGPQEEETRRTKQSSKSRMRI